MEFVVNPNQYAVSLNTYALPTVLPTGWKTPVANVATGALVWGGFPSTTYNPVVNIPLGADFNKLVGFAAGFSTSQELGVGKMCHISLQFAHKFNPTHLYYLLVLT